MHAYTDYLAQGEGNFSTTVMLLNKYWFFLGVAMVMWLCRRMPLFMRDADWRS